MREGGNGVGSGQLQASSGAEFLLLNRSYIGMEASAADKSAPEPVLDAVQGQTGRAAVYVKEGAEDDTP